MKIAYVCTDPGIPVFGSKGASVHVQAVLTELTRAGHELHLITPRPGGPAPARLSRAVAVHLMPAVTGRCAAEREISAQHSDGRVAALLEDLQPDLVYERYALWGRSATTWAQRRGVPSILEVNAPLIEEQTAFRELVDRRGADRVAADALSAASAVVCVSAGVAEWARATTRHPDRVLVEPNGVDPDRVFPANRPVTPAEAPVFTVGFVGTLKPWHGLEVLLDAFARLAAVDASWRLLLVGDGPMAEPLRARAAERGVIDQVRFTGAIPPADVARALHQMDVGCAPYPARGTTYFSPLKAYEYLAAGLPVVASAVGQLPEVLDHGRLGRLVPAGDAAALTAELGRVRADPTWRRAMRTEARAAALTRHSWSTIVDRILGSVTLQSAA